MGGTQVECERGGGTQVECERGGGTQVECGGGGMGYAGKMRDEVGSEWSSKSIIPLVVSSSSRQSPPCYLPVFATYQYSSQIFLYTDVAALESMTFTLN